jgi:hypothetical protein
MNQFKSSFIQGKRTALGRRLEAAALEVAAYLRGEIVSGIHIYNLESTKKIDQSDTYQNIKNTNIDKNSNN